MATEPERNSPDIDVIAPEQNMTLPDSESFDSTTAMAPATEASKSIETEPERSAATTTTPAPNLTATTRVLRTIELLTHILLFLDPITFTTSCPIVSHLFHSLTSTSTLLQQTHYLSPLPPSQISILIWRYKDSTPVRTPIKSFDLHPRLRISKDIRELDPDPMTWDRKIASIHPILKVQPSLSPRTVTDLKFDASSLLTSLPGPWLKAFLTQPPCLMSQIYIQKFVDVRRSAHRMKRYLDREDKSFATLGKLKAALERREEILDRGGSLGEALRKFDGDKALFIEGFIHEDAVLVKMAKERFPEAVDPAEMSA